VLKASRSNEGMVSHGGLFQAPVASHALRLRRPRSGGGDRLKPELQTLTAKNFFLAGFPPKQTLNESAVWRTNSI